MPDVFYDGIVRFLPGPSVYKFSWLATILSRIAFSLSFILPVLLVVLAEAVVEFMLPAAAA